MHVGRSDEANSSRYRVVVRTAHIIMKMIDYGTSWSAPLPGSASTKLIAPHRQYSMGNSSHSSPFVVHGFRSKGNGQRDEASRSGRRRQGSSADPTRQRTGWSSIGWWIRSQRFLSDTSAPELLGVRLARNVRDSDMDTWYVHLPTLLRR